MLLITSMSLRSLFVLGILLAAPFAYSNSCKSIFSPYKVPRGFQQNIYDQAMWIFQTSAIPFVESKHANPESATTPSEKVHLVALIMAGNLNLESINYLSEWSQHLPIRQRETFEKLATLHAYAMRGNVDEMYGYLEQLLRDKKYELWFEFVAKLHQSMQSVPYPATPGLSGVPITQSIKNFFENTGLVINADAKKVSYASFTQPIPWFSSESLTRHFDKRTRKDGYPMLQEQELLDAANNFILNSRSEQITFLRNDGTYAIFDPATKELAIVSGDNRIITYYILSERYKKPKDLAAYMKYVFTEPPSTKRAPH